MSNTKVLFCIFSHNRNENSKLWLDRFLEKGRDVFILDSGSEEPLDHERVIKYSNIYYGGMYDEAVRLCNEGNYGWLFFVCDDILIDDENFSRFLASVDDVVTSDDIAIYQPSTTDKSHNIWTNNINKGTDGIRDTSCIEGWMMLVRADVLNEMKKYGINYSQEMKYGWGVDVLLSYTSLNMGYHNVVDDSVIVEHPKGSAKYNSGAASSDMFKCLRKLKMDYVKITSACHIMKTRNTNKGVKILCCLLNYKHDENAVKLFNIFNLRFDTYIIDTFHKDDGSQFEGIVPENKIVYLNNVYWGGSCMEAYRMMCDKSCDYLLTVDTDVEITPDNAIKMLKALEIFNVYKNIGVYCPTLKKGSKCIGTTEITMTNCHLYNHGTGQLRSIHGVDGWFNVMNKIIMDDIFPKLKLPDNQYGWGVLPACVRRAIRRGLRVVADDRYEVFHPSATNYDYTEAKKEENKFKERFVELDCILPEELMS